MFSINLQNKIRIINWGSFWSLVTLHRTIPTWFEPYGFTQSKALKEISLILGVVSSCIFLPFSSCSCKDHLGFALCQGKYEFQALHWLQKLSSYRRTWWILKTVMGRNDTSQSDRSPSPVLRSLSTLSFFLLSSFLPPRTNNHLLGPDLETVPSTFTCLRDRSNTFTSQKVFWWIILSPFRYRKNLRKVFVCFASSRSFVVVESEWGLYFCWIVKKPILFLYRGKDLGGGSGGMRWSVDFSSHQ